MDLGNDWNPSEATLQKIMLLEQLAADPSDASAYVPLPDFAGAPGSEQYKQAVAQLYEFRDRGWADVSETLDGSVHALVLPAGRAAFERIRDGRANRPARYRAARDAVLHWLNECYTAGSGTPNIGDFLRTAYSVYYGVPFTLDEIDKATLWLREEGYITGQGAWGSGVIRPTITPKGQRVADSGRSVNDIPEAIVATPSIQVSGSHNTIMSHSPGAIQNVTTTITEDHRQQTIRLAELLEQSLPGLQLPSDAAELPGEIRQAADSKDPGIIATVLNTAKSCLITRAGTALADYVIQEIHRVLQLIGMG